MVFNYYARITPAPEGGYVIRFPDLNANSQAGSREEALEMAQDAMKTFFFGMIELGRDLPTPRRHRGKDYRLFSLSAIESMKVELYLTMRTTAVSRAKLAARMGVPASSITRLLDLDHHSRLDQLESAFRALGKKLAVNVEAA